MAEGLVRVQRETAPVRRQVVEMVREAIMSGALKPGQRLIERELTEQTGVSRNIVREALRELSSEGLVTATANRGTVVATLTRKETVELFDVRCALESLAARQFAERASESQVRALRRAVDGVARAAESGRNLVPSKDRFYEALFEGADNDTVRHILSGLHARITVLRTRTLSQPDRPPKTLTEISAIVEAIENRDADAAERLMRQHVELAAAAALASLDSGESDPSSTLGASSA